jgi:hypothetical protein
MLQQMNSRKRKKMMTILQRSERDADFSWQDQYRAPFIALPGLKEAVVITKISDFENVASQLKNPASIREMLQDALMMHSSIRLLPVK